MDYSPMIDETFRSCQAYVEQALNACRTDLVRAIEESIASLGYGGTLFFAGNGGSAADCSHIASELVGSFESITAPLPAISLTTDVAILTSVGNDYSFNSIFIQQVKALVKPNDLLWAISTSGESANLLLACEWAKTRKIKTIGLLGKNGGKLSSIVDSSIIVPGDNTQRIQEVHILILHILASALKRKFPDGIPQSNN
jgi:D-sedoheptulose 7-phosphate isomerase